MTQIHTPTIIFHHGSKKDFAHTIETARNACMNMPNCKLIIAPNREITFQHMIPFIIENGGSGENDSPRNATVKPAKTVDVELVRVVKMGVNDGKEELEKKSGSETI